MGGMSYTYDAYGRRITAADVWHAMNYSYDARNRFATVSGDVNTPFKAAYQHHNVTGQITQMTIDPLPGTGGMRPITQTRSYDSQHRLTGIAQNTPAVSMQPNGYTANYTYDIQGQRETQSSNLFGSRSYEYDVLGQLTREANDSGNTLMSYAYDLIGNRVNISKSGDFSRIYATDEVNRYETITTGGTAEVPEYDADGNLKAVNGCTLTWDGENRLISATKGPVQYVYSYDAFGRRTSEAYSGPDTATYPSRSFIWDGWNIHTETIGMDIDIPSTRICYVWGEDLSGTLQGAGGVGGLLFQTVMIGSQGGGETSFPLYDGNGNATVYVAPDGVYRQMYSYDGFLNAEPQIVNGEAFRFRGSTKSWNEFTGLLDYQLRSYNPQTGRWIQEDPIQEQGGVNLYGFVNNNPNKNIDVRGTILIQRNNQEFSKICLTSKAETIDDIVNAIRLDKNEWKKWLLTEEHASVDRIESFTWYLAPNTFVIATGNNTGVSTAILARWSMKLYDAAYEMGFNVINFRADVGTSVSRVISKTKEKSVWGYAFFGHGYAQTIIPYMPAWFLFADEQINGSFVWDESSDNMDIILEYNLRTSFKYALGINYHCHAEKQDWKLHSINYYGSNGVLSSLSGPRGIGYWGSWEGLLYSVFR
ncbi:RHS repeat domain-containing protein [Victivallis sp. Marseille-Q1083]|uniref:RHS repeat domain-containing protein n=1 Tax=Victivallis sp. Marseille-Q1083 TaxID=2717288 RepID=UPI00158A6720|nr:RHS repeat-associated core domain-containing protein [Victivallis sp. Marseille-Q1083]